MARSNGRKRFWFHQNRSSTPTKKVTKPTVLTK